MAMAFAKALIAMNIPERSTVIIQGKNSPEHLACLMGTILANCVATEIYPNNSHDTSIWQAQHCEAKVIVCDSYDRLYRNFLKPGNLKEQLPDVKVCILFSEGRADK